MSSSELIAEASARSDGEVVTHALSRDIKLPHTTGTAVLITLDNGRDHTRPNTLGARGLSELNRAIDAALARDDVLAIAVTGKPFMLAAGADLSAFSKIVNRDDALAIARIGHAVYDKLHTSQVPTFAFINGLALGGGLELTLHCHYRTVSAAAPGIALPECFLGLLPGWGGAYLVPNLIGADRAVQLIIENPLSQNKMLTGAAGVRARPGRCDLRWCGLPRSLLGLGGSDCRWIAHGDPARGRPRRVVERCAGSGPQLRRQQGASAPRRGRTARSSSWLQPGSADRAAAYAAEDEALADLIMSPELRANLYAFDLVRKRARRPAGAPDPTLARPVTKVGIVGAGLMASQLTILFLRRLHVPVVITDLDQERVDKGLGYVSAEIDRLLGKRRISPDEANRLRALVSGTTELVDFADCDFVIEAVFEEMSIKKQVFADLEKHVSASCVLATNTSSLSVAQMAADLDHPERVVGFHFFNPVAVLPLLEIVRAPATDDETLATAFQVAKTLKKNAVLVKDSAGFVVNRLLLRLMAEIFAAVDEGTPVPVADAALRPLGSAHVALCTAPAGWSSGGLACC